MKLYKSGVCSNKKSIQLKKTLDPIVTISLILFSRRQKMTKWYVKELSNITQVSVQTLHHYDRIDLLKPSIRLSNGYRLYSEKDLSKLQQIIALKFFGFELSQIKELLNKDVNLIDHFSMQSQILEKRSAILLNASKTLKMIIADCSEDNSIPWETIIKLIEVYRMTQQYEKTWAGKALNQEELKQYASFEQHLKDSFTADEQKAFEKSWDDIVNEVKANLKKDPTSQDAIEIGKRCMDWVNSLYGKEYLALRNTIWEKGFKGGYIGEDHKLSPDAVAWLDKAIETYYESRVSAVLAQIGTKPDAESLEEWENLLTEMFGDDQNKKNEIVREASKQGTSLIKGWLKRHYG